MTDIEQHEAKVAEAKQLIAQVRANVETLGWIEALRTVVREPTYYEIDEGEADGWDLVAYKIAYEKVNENDRLEPARRKP